MRNAPLVPANKAVSISKAQRSGHNHRCAHAPALYPPRCATKNDRGSVRYGLPFVSIGKPYSTERARPTRHCSRPLRAQDRPFFERLIGARARHLNANPFGVRGASSPSLFDMVRRIAVLERPLCLPRGVPALVVHGVVRTPVVLSARPGQRDRVLRVVPCKAR